ncbi:unnamed protein product [Euphydryas editha]|uniref:Microtubule-associated protein Jupiter n=1 Tax=Euphydryas editha TaxID=104508 RepID=A0AAU9UAG0_EUPED|nr:unnamed protein product [Euphydryas editha]
MTSTSFNVGIGDGSRLSSRVLRPPGGGHTDIFGGDPEPPRGRRPGPAAAPSLIGQGDEPAKPTNGAVTPNQNGQASETQQAPAPEPVQTPAPAPSPQTPQTPPESVSPKAVTPTDPKSEPPKRVRVPPGGFSSGLW